MSAESYGGGMPHAVVTLLQDALGDAVSTAPADLEAVREDRSGWRSATPPIAVVHAASVAEVQAVMRIAHETSTPVVPRGAGTGLAGGAIASPGAIVIDLSRICLLYTSPSPRD